MSKWIGRPHGVINLDAGSLKIAITDQRDRDCGWVWHVSSDGVNGGDTIEQNGGFDSADDAKRAVCAWVRAFCEKTLADITEAEAA